MQVDLVIDPLELIAAQKTPLYFHVKPADGLLRMGVNLTVGAETTQARAECAGASFYGRFFYWTIGNHTALAWSAERKTDWVAFT
jgi:hypothetical protein